MSTDKGYPMTGFDEGSYHFYYKNGIGMLMCDYESKYSKKEYEYLNCKIEKSANDKLVEICKITSLSKTAAVECAIHEYYAKVKKTGKV